MPGACALPRSLGGAQAVQELRALLLVAARGAPFVRWRLLTGGWWGVVQVTEEALQRRGIHLAPVELPF
jgi:hypothetical protein